MTRFEKLFFVLPILCLLLAGCSGTRNVRTDSVELADSANNVCAGQPGYDKATAGFLVDAADARMMDIKEGHAAIKQGLDPAIRNYGRLMVKDQTALLNRLRKLSAMQHITLPAEISNSKKEGFSQLAELTGDDFDDKFVKMMLIDHERDVKQFDLARTLPNPAVAAFATERLPEIQSHLDKLQAIRDKRKK